jgi:hypothetical protein
MRGWRIKFLFLLIVYFAGFATAVYCLAPVPEDQTCESDDEKSFLDSALKSDDFAKSFNTGMHKCIDFGKNAASHTAKFIKQKLDERQLQTDG